MNPALEQLATALKTRPAWLAPHNGILERTLQLVASASVAHALNEVSKDHPCPVRFVDHAELPAHEPYEAFIARTGAVPTRDDPHDLLNGIAWLAYPRTKQRLNALQSSAIAREGIAGARGELRDALTLFDENGAVLSAPAALVDALRARDWHSLFVARRELWQSAQLVLFGHALLEKLAQPRKAITAHVWMADTSDAPLAATFSAERLTPRAFLPLPVLGVPGWWPANEDPAFYADAAVFRPLRNVNP
jgi:Protein of unknown function (DUF3025)